MTQTWRERLSERMEAKGLSMKELSLRTGLGETAVRDMLKRSGTPSVDNLARVIVTSVGTHMLRVLRPGTKRGLYTLRAYRITSPDIEDARITWAAPIRLIVRGQ